MQTAIVDISDEEKRNQLLKGVAEDLKTGRLPEDCIFDQVYSDSIRGLSKRHWTPVRVALRIAALLVRNADTRVLDVGSGSGKFCIVGSLASPAHFTGVEQRPHFVEFAKKAAMEMTASRTEFIQGNMADLDWSIFDAYYLFNPFYENVNESIRIDWTVTLDTSKFKRYVRTVQTKLKAARVGTRVATYHGFGGEFPPCYQRIKREPAGSSCIEVWEKVSRLRSVINRISHTADEES
ncbi:methyltransferase domain-containing protein [Bdellovibrionota bacterium FG-2]